ncbi:carbohydrate ABC transporter permease [Streptomyces sp. NPDC058773]|uniref:carbohydrate ABC transporter permease n=1 Tax=Streptomyces sp. NPDC058773 TaxID=3346632 RepID=UPI00369CA33B
MSLISRSTRPPARAAASSRSPGPEPVTRLARAGTWARRAPLLPAMVFLVVVTQLPFVVTLVISSFSWNSLDPTSRRFSGLANYARVFTDGELRSAVGTTVVLTVSVVAVSLALGLAVALLLNRTFRGRGIVRTLFIAPFLIVPVAAALLWKDALFNPNYGLLNGILTWAGGLFGSAPPVQPDWISSMPRAAVEAALIWQWTPFMMLILLAGLQSQPADAIEAARVDGASSGQIFRHLTLPHLRRYLELGTLLGSIYIVQNFDAVFTLTSGGLGTANLPYSIYETFYQAHEYGQASANAVVVLVATIIIATFALRVVSSLFREETSR